MKKKVEKEVTFCDFCNKESWLHECLICGKGACCACRKVTMIEYKHSICFSGSDDGSYCNECLSKPIPEAHQALLQAYHKIATLRDEYQAYYKDFVTRSEAAEEALKQLLPK